MNKHVNLLNRYETSQERPEGLGNRNFLFTKLSKRTLRLGSRISTVDQLWSTEVHKWIEQIGIFECCRQR